MTDVDLRNITRTIVATGEAQEWAYNGFVYLNGRLIASDHGATKLEVSQKQRRYVEHLLEKTHNGSLDRLFPVE